MMGPALGGGSSAIVVRTPSYSTAWYSWRHAAGYAAAVVPVLEYGGSGTDGLFGRLGQVGIM